MLAADGIRKVGECTLTFTVPSTVVAESPVPKQRVDMGPVSSTEPRSSQGNDSATIRAPGAKIASSPREAESYAVCMAARFGFVLRLMALASKRRSLGRTAWCSWP